MVIVHCLIIIIIIIIILLLLLLLLLLYYYYYIIIICISRLNFNPWHYHYFWHPYFLDDHPDKPQKSDTLNADLLSNWLTKWLTVQLTGNWLNWLKD